MIVYPEELLAARVKELEAENEQLRELLSEAIDDLRLWREREYDPNDEWPIITKIEAALAGKAEE